MEKSTFYEDVYEVVKLIPVGRVTSYGAIAKYLGTGRSARMVGYAMNEVNKSNQDVPAHRVVNRNGQLSGAHAFGGNLMAERLESEGVKVENAQIINFSQHFWDPMQELG